MRHQGTVPGTRPTPKLRRRARPGTGNKAPPRGQRQAWVWAPGVVGLGQTSGAQVLTWGGASGNTARVQVRPRRAQSRSALMGLSLPERTSRPLWGHIPPGPASPSVRPSAFLLVDPPITYLSSLHPPTCPSVLQSLCRSLCPSLPSCRARTPPKWGKSSAPRPVARPWRRQAQRSQQQLPVHSSAPTLGLAEVVPSLARHFALLPRSRQLRTWAQRHRLPGPLSRQPRPQVLRDARRSRPVPHTQRECGLGVEGGTGACPSLSETQAPATVPAVGVPVPCFQTRACLRAGRG